MDACGICRRLRNNSFASPRAVDPSAAGGMGSSREVAVAALAEPAILLSLFAVAWRSGGTDLSGMSVWLQTHGAGALAPSQLLASGALMIAVIAETGRVP